MSSESDFSELSIDSTYVKSRCKKRAFNAIGVSRAGKTSKIHIAVDERGRPRKIILTAGNINDCDVACELLDDFNLQGNNCRMLYSSKI